MTQRVFLLRSPDVVREMRRFVADHYPRAAAMGKPLVVTVSEYHERRSGPQNRRYWALLRTIAEAAEVDGRRFSADVWHVEFATRLIGYEMTPSGVKVPISTTTLSKGEFTEYMDRIEAIAATELELDLAIPA